MWCKFVDQKQVIDNVLFILTEIKHLNNHWSVMKKIYQTLTIKTVTNCGGSKMQFRQLASHSLGSVAKGILLH